MLSLKRLLLARSQCQLPLSSIPPSQSHWFRHSVLALLLFAPHTWANWIFYFLLCSLEHTVLVLSLPPSCLMLLSLCYTSHLMALFPSCFSKSSIACSTIMRSLSKEVHEAERDVIDRAVGCAEVIVPLLTSLPACLPAWSWGAPAWCCMLMSGKSSSGKVKNAEVGWQKEGRMWHCVFTQLGGKEKKWKWSEHRSFLPNPLSSAWEIRLLCSSADEREARSCV